MALTVKQGRLKGKFARSAHPGIGGLLEGTGLSAMSKISNQDGYYTMPGSSVRYRVRKGGSVPARATFHKAGSAVAPEAPKPNPVIKESGFPVWYEKYREKAIAEDGEAHAMFEGETNREFMERIADYQRGGGMTTLGSGPSDTDSGEEPEPENGDGDA